MQYTDGWDGVCGEGGSRVRRANTERSFALLAWPLHKTKMHKEMFLFEGYTAKIKCEFLTGTPAEATQYDQHNYKSCCICRSRTINPNASAYEAYNSQLRLTALLATQGLFGILAVSLLRVAQEEGKKCSTQSSVPIHLESRARPSPAKLQDCRNTAEVCDYWP